MSVTTKIDESAGSAGLTIDQLQQLADAQIQARKVQAARQKRYYWAKKAARLGEGTK